MKTGMIAGLAALAATAVQAGDGWMPEGDGFVELYYAVIEDERDEPAVYGDFMLSFRPGGQAFGFDAGTFGARSVDEGNGIFYWAGTWFLPGGGKLSVGNPRTAYDLFARSVHNAAHGALGNSMLRSQLEQDEFSDGGGQYGASYLGGNDSLQFAMSAHGYEFESVDTWSMALGASYTWRDYTVAAAFERSNDDLSRDINRFKLGLAADYGRIGLGTTYRVREQDGDTGRSWESFLTYQPAEEVEITGTFQSFSGDETSVSGLAAKYNFTDRGYVRIGTVNAGRSAYSAAVGFEF